MLEDLENEVEVINSIYGEGALEAANQPPTDVYVLQVPNQDASLTIQFPADYPEVPPLVLGTHSSGKHAKRGHAARVLKVFDDAVGRLFQPGAVCLFDAIEDVTASLSAATGDDVENTQEDNPNTTDEIEPEPQHSFSDGREEPPWSVSDAVEEHKSVFVARCARVSSPAQATRFLQHLLETDKKAAKATHNITAHRIKAEHGVTFQDCDDDGETAAGGRLLHLMQVMDLWDVMVVVTRWYGGQKLGPARFGIINSVARDAFVKGGFVNNQEPSKTTKR